MIITLFSLGLALGSGSQGALEPLAAASSTLVAPRDAYAEIYNEYKNARREHRIAERVARQEDRIESFNAPHPILAFFDRFEALAKQGNVNALFFCALEVQQLGRPMEETKRFKAAAYERLSTEFVTHELMGKVITKLGREAEWLTEKQMTSVLGRIAKQGAGDKIRSEASYKLARRLEDQGTAFGVKRAKEIYAFVQKTFPETRAAKNCVARLAGLELAPGNEAPDFSAVDSDGNAFKLSDYRGKVVVLDFWGFW